MNYLEDGHPVSSTRAQDFHRNVFWNFFLTTAILSVMNMKKLKSLALALGALIALGAFASCASTDPPPTQ